MIEELSPLRGELAVVGQREPLQRAPLIVVQVGRRILGLVDDLIWSDFMRIDLDVRGERLQHQRAGCAGGA
jgi:hypothetical protein